MRYLLKHTPLLILALIQWLMIRPDAYGREDIAAYQKALLSVRLIIIPPSHGGRLSEWLYYRLYRIVIGYLDRELDATAAILKNGVELVGSLPR